MTYPPPPGPPGSDGWPDPTQPYPQNPSQAFPPPQQQPPPQQFDPYQPPPASDPYAPSAPAYSPTSGASGTPPMQYTAPPGYQAGDGSQPGFMSAPPHMQNPGQPGYPPGYPQGFPQPPAKNNTPLIVGGVAGVVVVVLLVVIALVATGAFDGDDDTPPVTSPTSEENPDPEQSHDPSDPESNDPGPVGGTYTYQPDLCDKLDYSAYEKWITLGEIQADTYDYYGGNTRCAAMPDAGSFTVDTYWYESADQAIENYQTSIDIYMNSREKVTDISGGWDNAQLGENEPWDDKSCDGIIVAQAGNATVMVRFWIIAGDKAVSQDDAVAAMKATVEEVLSLSSS